MYGAVITLRSYFGVFSDIAKMWNELSKHHIMPGLKMCDELAVTADEDSGQMIKKVKVLEEWAQKASDAVAKIAREVCFHPSLTTVLVGPMLTIVLGATPNH